MSNMILKCYQARNNISDQELLDMIHNDCLAVINHVEALRATGTETREIQGIQQKLVEMCAAIQVYAPDMINFEYTPAATRTIDDWRQHTPSGGDD